MAKSAIKPIKPRFNAVHFDPLPHRTFPSPPLVCPPLRRHLESPGREPARRSDAVSRASCFDCADEVFVRVEALCKIEPFAPGCRTRRWVPLVGLGDSDVRMPLAVGSWWICLCLLLDWRLRGQRLRKFGSRGLVWEIALVLFGLGDSGWACLCRSNLLFF